MKTREILKENLKFYRKQANLTQEELAERINCSPKYISSIESKSSFPSAETIDSISEVLGVSPAKLFEEQGCPENLISFDKDKFSSNLVDELHKLLKKDVLEFLNDRL